MSATDATAGSRHAEIQGHRPYLVRYALAQLRDAELAEEAVQEALLAALEGIGRFDGRSTLRTWLTSILRFKIVDLQRRLVAERRNVELDGAGADGGDESFLDELFDETGHWREPPATWGDPEAAFEQGRFWEAFERCLDRLPETTRRVFFRRAVAGDETADICREEGITSANCWVILHRARAALRDCLQAKWFGGAARG